MKPIDNAAWQAQESALRHPRTPADTLLAEFLATPQARDELPAGFALRVLQAAEAQASGSAAASASRRSLGLRGASAFEAGLALLALGLLAASVLWWWFWPARGALPAVEPELWRWALSVLLLGGLGGLPWGAVRALRR